MYLGILYYRSEETTEGKIQHCKWGPKIRNSRLFLTSKFFDQDYRVDLFGAQNSTYSTIWIKKNGGQKKSGIPYFQAPNLEVSMKNLLSVSCSSRNQNILRQNIISLIIIYVLSFQHGVRYEISKPLTFCRHLPRKKSNFLSYLKLKGKICSK